MKDPNGFYVLLVEDNPQDVEMIRWAFQKEKLAAHMVVMYDGAEAIDFLFGQGAYATRNTESTPRVIILDLKLPKIDGIEVLRRIKADERTKIIPVVILTSSHEERDVQAGYHFGVNSYVVKPVNSEKFDQSIREMGNYWTAINHPLT
jgi:two-component system response regulator